jgi:hypothetical protein
VTLDKNSTDITDWHLKPTNNSKVRLIRSLGYPAALGGNHVTNLGRMNIAVIAVMAQSFWHIP